MEIAHVRQRLVGEVAGRLPFYYGWVILACVCTAGFSRQGPAVATLSIFVEPMTAAFGWSRTEISAAVSIGGILGAIISPFIGPLLDRNGARAMLAGAVLFTAVSLLLLSWTDSLAWFVFFFCIARMNFAGPYELGITGSIVSWFVRKRAFAISIATLAQMAGLVAMPLLAHVAIQSGGWRSGWLAIGATVLLVGFLPTWLLHVRRPEDMGLAPDGDPPQPKTGSGTASASAAYQEPAYTRRQAVATPAFWLLSMVTLLIYPVQAGISLHQAPYLIECGLGANVAAASVGVFSLLSGVTGFAYGFWPRRVPLRFALALVGLTMGASCLLMGAIASPVAAYAAAALFGAGVGGLLTILPIAWADYFGRQSYGAIRGVALSIQVVAQAIGPLLSGVLRDATGSYQLSLSVFAVLGLAGMAVALLTVPPRGLSRR